MFIRFALLCPLFFLSGLPLRAQTGAPHMAGEILVSLLPDARPEALGRRFEESHPGRQLRADGQIAELLNVWLFRTDTVPEAELLSLGWLLRQPEVQTAQFNHRLAQRGISSLSPDDPFFFQQWQYQNSGLTGGVPDADLDAPEAWDIATGGLTPAGDTIVVAVIDGGVDAAHPDMAPNLWVNWADLPDDDLDNDGNNYVDDTYGWNVQAQNDNIGGNSAIHGTPVCGIIGARGNNGTGVAGINWQVKILFVSGGGQVSSILAAYDYVWKNRRLYNASQGQKGAFIVAVNCSWGINYGQPSDAPLWCAAFDSLGAAGILSVAATANLPIDVDLAGDLPTGCGSEFLVSVTSLDKADLKAADAAWGAVSVDLGAYGQDVYTLSAGNAYGAHAGTSFAAPQVSGAVGLLYSAPCPTLVALAKTHPDQAALSVKNNLLQSATANAALLGLTLSGGRLNLRDLLEHYEMQCPDCPPPFDLQVIAAPTQSATLSWDQTAAFQSVALRWRATGASDWAYEDNATAPFHLSGLSSCTTYEFALSADCGAGPASAWSEPQTFQTDGCCLPPDDIAVGSISDTGALLVWAPVTAATGYRVRWRKAGGGGWAATDIGPGNSFLFSNLQPCAEYQVQLQTHCDTGSTAFTAIYAFQTSGCGPCTDAVYCAAGAGSAAEEWIAGVQIGNWSNASGNGGGGYENFTATSTAGLLQLEPFSSVPVTIVPGFAGSPYKEYFRIFVDFNGDGDFDDPGELAFDPGFAHDGPMSGQLTVPDFSAGITRLRVAMKYKGVQGTLPDACETFGFGQVEDYCVMPGTGLKTAELRNVQPLYVVPQPAAGYASLQLPGFSGAARLLVRDPLGRLMADERRRVENGLLQVNTADWPAGIYVAQIEVGTVFFLGRIVKM